MCVRASGIFGGEELCVDSKICGGSVVYGGEEEGWLLRRTAGTSLEGCRGGRQGRVRRVVVVDDRDESGGLSWWTTTVILGDNCRGGRQQ